MTPNNSVRTVRLVRPHERDIGTTQTPGMRRETGVAGSTVGAERIWAGYVTMDPGAASGAHHHGDCESAIFVVSGRVRIRFGRDLEESVDAECGDFIFVPPQVIHQEINLDRDKRVEEIVVRDSQANVVVNVDIPEARS